MPACEVARLSGGNCPPQGWYEPGLCDAGFYCPLGGKEKIPCMYIFVLSALEDLQITVHKWPHTSRTFRFLIPAKCRTFKYPHCVLLITAYSGQPGYYCPHGSIQQTKCSLGSWCPAQSVRDTNFLPLVMLLLLDILLITAAVIAKMRGRYQKNNQGPKAMREKMPWAKPAPRFVSRGQAYRQLDNEQYPGFIDNDFQTEPNIRMLNRRPTGFVELGLQEAEFVNELHNTDAEKKTDLHLFVQSLSKCLGATKFGLSFEFQDLGFKPPKSTKPILSDVSGTINAGSLWGVMGASGAGKCKLANSLLLLAELTIIATFVNVLMGKTAHTGGVTKVNGVAGKISKYGNSLVPA